MKKSVITVVLQTLSLFIPFAVSSYFNNSFSQNYLVAELGALDFFMVICLPVLWTALTLASFLLGAKPEKTTARPTQRVVLFIGLGLAVVIAIVVLFLDTYRLASSFYYATCYSITIGFYLIALKNFRETSQQ